MRHTIEAKQPKHRGQSKMAAQKAETPVKSDRKERGTGPMAVTYIDSENKSDLKRVPTNVKGVHVVANDNKGTKSYDVTALSPQVMLALAASAMAGRMKIFVANHAESSADVIKLTDQVYADFLAGKVYTRVEGGKAPGKKFDGQLYADAWKNVYAFMAKKGMKNKAGQPIKALSDDQVIDLKTKLEGMDPKERAAKLKGYNENKFFKKALGELKAKQIDTSDVEATDMPF